MQQPVRHRPSAVGNEPKRNARRSCMITQRLGAEEGDTPVEQQPAAMRDFDPTYDRCGSNSTHAAEAIRLFMSAMPPRATKLMRHNEPSRSANWRPEQVQQGARLKLRLLDYLVSEHLH